ncbi:penicillin-binding protein 2 [Granulicella aggregans]|uniref:Penicillin-binding protein 2 n=1 Tax=Granulicella aggregans TaxID=474949 RepID=A0A7W7ZAE7_9BACT|nr:penicillin-binding protein 2 [Granulicella aggregans]MBB5056173.1 penicillin-binding protein 2 [Granulicella aggregans]
MENTPQAEVVRAGNEEKLAPGKLHAAQYIVALVLVVLLGGLWRLQVIGASNYRLLAEANRIRKVPVLAPRGKLFDRDGRILVDNYPSVTCYILREQIRDASKDSPELALIARGLNLTVDQVQSILRHYQLAPKYEPIPLKKDITPDEQAFIAAHRDELPELETQDEQRRLYPSDGFAAHLIGYVGEVSEQMLDDERYAAYSAGDVVGRSGVEQTYDAVLRGTDGYRNIIVNSHGKEVGQLGQQLAVPGQDLKLTIDLDIQMAAEKALQGRNGAIVAMDPHTGEILALASRPTYDPNAFAVRLTKAYWSQIINDPEHPLLNKAIQAQLAPGSTFKIIMSVAGLEENVAQDMRVNCAGGATFYGHFYACDARHGGVDIHNAIPLSCDTFYYTLANRLGIDTIAKYATALGISQKTGIDLPNEASGTMPSTAWKLKTQHAPWYVGETISVGIGQGAVTVTPIQLARALGGIASGGAMQRPHVVFPDEVPSELRQAIAENFPGSGEKAFPLSVPNWQLITDAMAQTTITGTAAAVHMANIDFAGKTGTAQLVSQNFGAKGMGSGANRANAWFVGMVPRRNPDIVVAVLVEHGGFGGAASAPLAAQVINTFVTKKRKQDNNLVVAEVPKPKPAETPAPGEAVAAPQPAAIKQSSPAAE